MFSYPFDMYYYYFKLYKTFTCRFVSIYIVFLNILALKNMLSSNSA